ncbi:porin family protein [Maribacter antarcticus]|uniref:porin family protein n=1 Tax=Maribacter antarcticus TaxID=505250 RepID=UPI000684AA85|nr:porin family protein [Maribacter antarcticus]
MIALKTTTLILSLILVGTFTSSAQSNDSSNLEFGIKAGVNLSNLNNADGKRKISPLAGIFAEYRFTEKVSIRSEAMFSVQGAKKKGSFETVKLNYVNLLPALVKFYPVEKISIEAGPYVGLLLSKKDNNPSTLDYQKMDFGAVLGLGYRLVDNVEIGLRYSYGVLDITKTPGKIKNRTFQLALSYNF